MKRVTSEIVTWATVVLAVPSLGACPPTMESATPNTVSYDVDGLSVMVEEGLSFAFLDETKHLLGPNTHLYMEAGARSETPDEVLGDRLRINVPTGTSVGGYIVPFTALPGRETVWVSYRGVVSGNWSAYQGTVELAQVDGIGGRLKASFSELDLVDSCGQQRRLTNGRVDLAVGSEDGFPVSPIDMSDTSEWAELGATALIENNLVVELDGRLVACPFIDFGPKIVAGDVSGTGRDEEVLEVAAVCSCDHDGPDGIRPVSFSLTGYLPTSGHGELVADGSQYAVAVYVDVNETPDDLDDDELWMPSVPPRLRYQHVGIAAGARVDIELAAPLTLYRVDRDDPLGIRRLAVTHMYGFVNRRLGQQAHLLSERSRWRRAVRAI